MRKSVIVLLSVCAMTSCGKEDVEPQGHTGGEREKVAVVDGVLHFATTGDYFDFSVEMANKDPEERRAWEERNGFTSMLTFAEDVMGDPELRYGEALARPEIFSVSSDSVIDIEVPLVQSYGSDHFTSGPLEYNGKESVNHYFVSLVNVYSYNGRQLNESRPYITELKGNVYCGGILELLQLDKVFQNQ